jgi:hypothetical protein
MIKVESCNRNWAWQGIMKKYGESCFNSFHRATEPHFCILAALIHEEVREILQIERRRGGGWRESERFLKLSLGRHDFCSNDFCLEIYYFFANPSFNCQSIDYLRLPILFQQTVHLKGCHAKPLEQAKFEQKSRRRLKHSDSHIQKRRRIRPAVRERGIMTR